MLVEMTHRDRRSLLMRALTIGSAVAVGVVTVALDTGQAVSSSAASRPVPVAVPAPSAPPTAGAAPAPVRPLRTDRASGSPALFDRPTHASLSTTFDQLLGERKDDVSAYAVDLRTGASVSYGQTSGMATASMVKLDILLTLLTHEQASGTMPSAGETALATAMITHSDNDAASSLWSAVGGGSGVAAANQRFGLTDTVPGPSSYWGSTTTGAADQVRLLRQVVGPSSVLGPAYRAYALHLLESVEPDQQWGVSAASDGDADDPPLATKNGWLPRPVDGGRWVVTSVGRVTAGGDPLALAVLTRSSSSMDEGIALIESVAKVMRTALVAAPAGSAQSGSAQSGSAQSGSAQAVSAQAG
jgi:hypothetical protein